MKRTTERTEVNAGSMADIAFLLLIFFLVTAVIPKDTGINRKLPKECLQGENCNVPIPERNILKIAINAKDEIMIDEAIVTIAEVKDSSKTFIDNNGDSSCEYCKGNGRPELSDNPNKAVISLKTDRNTTYNQFIEVQDELTKAYYELRETYSKEVLKKSIDDLTDTELEKVRNAYPFILSEAETQ